MCERKMTFGGICAALAICVGLTGAYAADTVIGQIEVKNGTAGAAGAAGADGLSAYQIWLNNNHTGSEADFLASLVGATGAAGQDGAPGCATTITKSKTGKVTTLTAKDCNNTVEWTEMIEDGTDGNDGCSDEVDIGDKDAYGCVTITKTPYSLVNGTCTAGTTESQKVCEPKVCEPVISTTKDASTKCVTYSTQKRKANAAGTGCENDGAADTEVVCPLECESHEVSVPCGPAASGASELCEIATKKGIKTTKYKCDGTTVDGVVYTYDGDDAPDQCEGLSAADKASQIIKTSSVYKRPEGQQGYKEVTTVNCNNVTNTTYEYDPCGEVHAETVTSTVPNCNLTDGNAVMGCTDQTNQTKYYICQKIADSEAGVVPLGAVMEANKDQLQTEINKKLNTTDAESTYLNKTDAGNTYLATADLGTALKENSVKTDLASAVAGSGALTGYLTSADASSTYATQTALNNADGKITALESTVGDSNSGLVKQVATNTSTIGNASGGLVKDVADAKTNATTALNTANTASTDASQAKQDAASALNGLDAKLNKTDAQSTYLSKTDATSTYLKQADASSTYLTQNNASSTYATKSALSTVETTANNAATTASSALTTANTASGNATRALNKATTNETNISSLNTTVCGASSGTGLSASESGCSGGLVSSVSTLTSETNTLKTTVNGTCEGTGNRAGCTQSLEARIRALEEAVF